MRYTAHAAHPFMTVPRKNELSIALSQLSKGVDTYIGVDCVSVTTVTNNTGCILITTNF